MPKPTLIRFTSLAFVAISCLAATTTHAQQRPENFGRHWVRHHPFTLMGLQQWPHTFDAAEHRAAHMSSVLVWWADGNGKQIATPASASNLPWHALMVDGEGDERDRINDYASVGNAAGWMVGDELARPQFPFFADIVAWVKQNRPNDLVYTNAYPTYAGDAHRYGGTPPNGSYTYSEYLEDIVQMVKPDVLMYDHYPYVENLMRHDYFQNLMLVREKALEHDLPYWGFMLSSAHGAYRLPSRSDARMQMFSHLTAGFTGMAYFTFDNEPSFQYASILDTAGNPTVLYPIVADLNLEAANLGRALRFMASDDVKFVPGRHFEGAQIVKNPTPLGMTDWTASGDSDEHILNIVTNNVGNGLDGMIGFFTDDAGDAAFMLTNVYHGPAVPAGSALRFTITFDNTINELLRLDRITGEEVVVPLTSHQLVVTIPAGTGELYKYNEGSFILAVPEPGIFSLALGAALSAPLFVRRRRAA